MRLEALTVAALTSLMSCSCAQSEPRTAGHCPHEPEACKISPPMPASPTSRRFELKATKMAIASAETSETSVISSCVVLGVQGSPTTFLYLSFSPIPVRQDQIERAILQLYPIEQPGGVLDIRLRAEAVAQAWTQDSLVWANRPSTAAPPETALASGTQLVPIRFDVTEIVRRCGQSATRCHGFRIEAEESTDRGITLATGYALGPPPTLSVYAHASGTEKASAAGEQAP